MSEFARAINKLVRPRPASDPFDPCAFYGGLDALSVHPSLSLFVLPFLPSRFTWDMEDGTAARKDWITGFSQISPSLPGT